MVKGKAFRHKVGDTLIEVTFAIGIFSMVAIAAVSVINASTSGSQNILENTVTREEIDTQAEALRFIQAAYAASGEKDIDTSDIYNKRFNDNNKYAYLWNAMGQRALDPTNEDDAPIIENAVNTYEPETCNELYDEDYEYSIFQQRAFFINTEALGESSGEVKNILVTPEISINSMLETPTFPRILYGNLADFYNTSIYNPDESSSNPLSIAQGLFIVAVKDGGSTYIISDENGDSRSTSAYIDFYVRSCWFATGAERPSTISTVIRLSNPDAISVNKYTKQSIWISYDGGTPILTSYPKLYIPEKRVGKKFIGWKDKNGNIYPYENGKFTKRYIYKPDDPNTYNEGNGYTNPFKFESIWEDLYSLTYIDGNKNLCTEEIEPDGESYTFNVKGISFDENNQPYLDCNGERIALTQQNNTTFQGWSTDDSSAWYKEGDTITVAPDNKTKKLYSVWRTVITFSDDQWDRIGPKKVNDENNNADDYTLDRKNEPGCRIFHVNDLSSSCTGEQCSNYISAGTHWGEVDDSYNIAPMNGYLVSSYYSQHIETFENGINFQGYCYNSGRENKIIETIKYNKDIKKEDKFELSFIMNTLGMTTHPGGYAAISIGPLEIHISDEQKIQVGCNKVSDKKHNFPSGTKIKLAKDGINYSITINDSSEPLETCTSEDTAQVSYSMMQGNHYCPIVFSVLITDIDMTHLESE